MKLTSLAALVALSCLSSCGCGGDSFPAPAPVTPPPPLPPPPLVESVSPLDQAADVALDTEICVVFTAPVTGVDAQTFQVVQQGGPIVPGQIVFTDPSAGACFVPTVALLPCTVYDVLVGAAITDAFGQPLTAFVSSFTTTGPCNPPPPPPPPVVLSVGPSDLSTDVALDTEICVVFSAPVTGVDALTFLLVQRGGPFVPGQIVFTDPSAGACFVPTDALLPCTVYDVVLAAAIMDEFGQPLTAFGSSFTTAGTCNPPPPPAPCVSPVPLGTAEPYAVLAGSTVTNTGPTTLDGNLGLHPGSSVTGAPIVTGVTHIADAEALQAKADLVIAYDAAAAAPTTASRIGDIGGEVLTAGVYTSTSALSVEIADLILVGGPDDVFIFQMVSSLTIGSGRKILLQGVRSCNVIWQVGSSATLNSGAEFVGTILALTDINLLTGATVQGRLLARNGQVVLDTNTVTVP